MKTALLTVSNQPERTKRLRESAAKHNWLLTEIYSDWHGFGTKLIKVYEWLVQHPDVTHFFFCDGHDVIVLGSQEEVLSKLNTDIITCSAERGVWPKEEYRKYYEPQTENGWDFLNSGLYFAPRGKFMTLFEENQPDYITDDQLWLSEQYLFNDGCCIELDRDQSVFNSHSFIREGDYGYENGRVQVNGQTPVFVHCNGGVWDDKLNELL